MELCLVIPSYNRADLIGDTIESALNQTRPFKQIIVVDDASTDNTLDVLARFGERITVIAAPKIGVQRARNLGVEKATTPYVTLCDSDDLLTPNHVETIANWLDSHDACDAIYTNHQVFTGADIQNDTFSRAPADFFHGSVRDGSFATGIPDLYAKTSTFQPLLVSGITLRTAFYTQIGGFDPAFDGVPSEDWEFTLRVVKQGNVALCMDAITHIRRHPGNESKSRLRQRLGEIAVLEHARLHHGCSDNERKVFQSMIDTHRLWAFEEAFGRKKIPLAATIFPLLGKHTNSLKFRIKSVMIRAYILATNFSPLSPQHQYRDAIE
jgi:glycosyltransferase involved in cell wall biosynthesis